MRYVEIYFNGSEDKSIISGNVMRTGYSIVCEDGEDEYTLTRFKYVPPVFKSPYQNRIIREPGFVLTNKVGSKCSCGFVLDCYACELSYYKRPNSGVINCPVCGRSIIAKTLHPVITSECGENEDVLYSGKYADDEFKGLEYRKECSVGDDNFKVNLLLEYDESEVDLASGCTFTTLDPYPGSLFVKYEDVMSLHKTDNCPSVRRVIIHVPSNRGYTSSTLRESMGRYKKYFYRKCR